MSMINEYDSMKNMLNKVRTLKQCAIQSLHEQSLPGTVNNNGQVTVNNNSETSNEANDVLVINNVDIVIHSEDTQDMTFSDEEKSKVSQMIDDFRTEVSEIADFEKLNLYDNSGKLNGKIGNMGIQFMLSAGDDEGLYLTDSMLKIDNESLDLINKLKTFEEKFKSVINILIINRKQN